MLKRAFLAAAVVLASLFPALGQGETYVYFWRDARGVAHYSDLCPAGTGCSTKRLWDTTTRSTDVSAVPLGTHGNHRASGPYASGVVTYYGGSQLQFASAVATSTSAAAASSGGASTGGASGAGAGSSDTTQPSTDTTSAPSGTTSAPSGATSPVRLRSPIGTNLDGIAYWSPQLPFVNVMKSSSAWISGDSSKWDNGQALDLDANGWVRSLAPGQIARKLMLREIGDRYPAGQYLVRYKGEGTMKFGFAARVVSQNPGETVIQVTPGSGGVHLTIEQTNRANYIRDIAITMPGGICEGDPFTHVSSAEACGSRTYLSFADHHSSIVFYPVFADRLRSYSVLRFMDWMATNNSPVASWSQRTPLAYATWATSSGAPPEVMIQLANVVGAHPWFNIPHQADDAYVLTLAQLVKEHLDPGLNVYVEHSNEVWNTLFKQWATLRDQAAAHTPPIDNIQYHALRSRSIGQTFKGVIGESRVVSVLGAQAANPWTATHGLEYLKKNVGSSGSLGIDAVAIAPYFGAVPGPADANRYTAMTLDEFVAFVRTSVLPGSFNQATTYRKIADQFRLRLIAYEGGQHMVGHRGAENNAALNQLFDAFNRDSRMKQLYLEYLKGWRQGGGELFVHFTDVSRYTKWGRWGALEYVGQAREAAPKFDGIQSFIESNPVWWTQ